MTEDLKDCRPFIEHWAKVRRKTPGLEVKFEASSGGNALAKALRRSVACRLEPLQYAV